MLLLSEYEAGPQVSHRKWDKGELQVRVRMSHCSASHDCCSSTVWEQLNAQFRITAPTTLCLRFHSSELYWKWSINKLHITIKDRRTLTDSSVCWKYPAKCSKPDVRENKEVGEREVNKYQQKEAEKPSWRPPTVCEVRVRAPSQMLQICVTLTLSLLLLPESWRRPEARVHPRPPPEPWQPLWSRTFKVTAALKMISSHRKQSEVKIKKILLWFSQIFCDIFF